MAPIVKRQKLFSSYDKSVKKWGKLSTKEFEEEVAFLGFSGKIKDVSPLFTNDLIDEINAFDAEKIRKQAHDFKIPSGESGG